MSGHTPGPWTCLDEQGRVMAGSGQYLVMTNDYEFVATTPVPIHSIPWPKEEAVANARLIAAAPEMLEALEATEALFRSLDEMDEHEAQIAHQVSAALAKARAEA